MKNEDIQMNEFESILQREKDAKYQLPNKELFSFAVMAKIAAKKSRHSALSKHFLTRLPILKATIAIGTLNTGWLALQ